MPSSVTSTSYRLAQFGPLQLEAILDLRRRPTRLYDEVARLWGVSDGVQGDLSQGARARADAARAKAGKGGDVYL